MFANNIVCCCVAWTWVVLKLSLYEGWTRGVKLKALLPPPPLRSYVRLTVNFSFSIVPNFPLTPTLTLPPPHSIWLRWSLRCIVIYLYVVTQRGWSFDFHMYTMSWREGDHYWFSHVYDVMKRGWSLLIFTCIRCHEERVITIDFHMYTMSWREDDLYWFSHVYDVMKRGWSLLIFTCIRCHEERVISIDFHM